MFNDSYASMLQLIHRIVWSAQSLPRQLQNHLAPQTPWQEFPIAPLSASDKLSDPNYLLPKC